MEVASAGRGASVESEPQRTLVIAGGREPETLASKPLRDIGGAGIPRAAIRAFNAGLAIADSRVNSHPYLAEALPELGTDTWRVAADGTMDTTYRLRGQLSWHDGAPLTAEDFVFAWRVYTTPEIGLSASVPVVYLQEVTAPDDRTVVLRWQRPFAGAGALLASELPPLPRHLLETPFAQLDAGAFAALPFWTGEYVGAGPYRLARWERGAFLEAEGFPADALGEPQIDRIRFTFVGDSNAAVATMLAGTADVLTHDSLDVEQTVELERQWSGNRAGIVQRNPVGIRYAAPQLRAAYANPSALLDPRVRQALVHATDKQALADTLTAGLGSPADTMVLPLVGYFNDVRRNSTTYPHDLRQADERMGLAGWTRGADGMYVGPGGSTFPLEIAVAAGRRNANEVAIIADNLRRAGFDTSIRVIPREQIIDRQMRATLPGILNQSYQRAYLPPTEQLRAAQIPSAENRWQGSNQTGWSNPEFERLAQAFETSLERRPRDQAAVAMLKLISDEVPVYPLYYSLSFMAYSAKLLGPTVSVSEETLHWNLPQWSWIPDRP
jgi:peptide/nickel transport system substrate-binding protein